MLEHLTLCKDDLASTLIPRLDHKETTPSAWEEVSICSGDEICTSDLGLHKESDLPVGHA